jgi:hypothetical protein
MKQYVKCECCFDASESETLCMVRSSHRGNRAAEGGCMRLRRLGSSLRQSVADGTVGKGYNRTADMTATEESDDLVVPTKRAN